MSTTWHHIDREGTGLACADYGGEGDAVLLLHGLCGHAEEWDETASWLVCSHRVIAPDARGHGRSERLPRDVSRSAHVADALAWIKHFDLNRAIVVGQSLGGHTAFLLAADRPDLIRSLVVIESAPAAGPNAPETIKRWLESWPVPFPTREAALNFFGGDKLWARAWVDGMERSDDGLRPRFDNGVMVASLEETASTDYWDRWDSIQCPTLIVRGEMGALQRAIAQRMVETLPRSTCVEVAAAGHDVHLEQPAAWRETLERFLATPSEG